MFTFLMQRSSPISKYPSSALMTSIDIVQAVSGPMVISSPVTSGKFAAYKSYFATAEVGLILNLCQFRFIN